MPASGRSGAPVQLDLLASLHKEFHAEDAEHHISH